MQQRRGTRFAKTLLKKIKNIIEDDGTKSQYRQSQKDFVRQRCLSFSSLVYFFLQKGKSSLQQELDDFFVGESKTYSKSALSQHRNKLKYELFADLNTQQLDYFYQNHKGFKKWKGMRLLAIDGSTLQLPYSHEVIKDFGIFETRTENNRKVLLGRISQVYDVLNELTIHASIEHYNTSELGLAERHLPDINKTDLVLMDRGYAAFWLMARMESQGQKFLIRLKENKWKIAKELLLSGKNQSQVIVMPSSEAKLRCKEKGIPTKDLGLRIVRVPIPEGDDYVLITNLTDEKLYDFKELAYLYRSRWPIEESFKLLKTRAELENLSGKSTLAIKQDFYRIIFRANLSQIISLAMTQKPLEYINKTRKHKYKINRTQAYRKSKTIIQILYESKIRAWITHLYTFGHQLVTQLEIVRPNRSHPVVKRYAGKPISFMAYKP